jgi:N-acyl-D-aspartate/D-glutamate deacylase
MTSLPAEIIGLKDRGLLAPGMAADLVVFDPATVMDTADFQKPHSFPTGIDWVIVNGVPVVEEGKQNDLLPGRVLRR